MFSTPADIETQACRDLLRMAGYCVCEELPVNLNRVLLDWRMLAAVNGRTSMTVSGVLFLASCPQRFLPHACVVAQRVSGREAGNETANQKRIEGRLLSVIEDTLRFLDAHLQRPNHSQRFNSPLDIEIPLFVLREAIINAIAHRDYTISSPIRVLIYDDQVAIHSPGNLPDSLTLESLPFGMHVFRNPWIYTMLYRMKLVMDTGNGIPRMIRQTREFTGFEPSLSLEGNELILSLPRRNLSVAPSPA